MRRTGMMAAALSLVLAATACSSGAAKVLVQDTPTPAVSASSTPSTAASAPANGPAAATTHRATGTQVVATTSASSGGATGSAKPAATQRPASAPKTTAPATQTTAVACSGSGSTTTIQMVTGDRFSPSAVTVNRCDAVKAVYADTTGVPHNWQGHGWTSPDMTSAGQSYTYRFTSTGTFSFFCSYHQGIGMTGTVTVH